MPRSFLRAGIWLSQFTQDLRWPTTCLHHCITTLVIHRVWNWKINGTIDHNSSFFQNCSIIYLLHSQNIHTHLSQIILAGIRTKSMEIEIGLLLITGVRIVEKWFLKYKYWQVFANWKVFFTACENKNHSFVCHFKNLIPFSAHLRKSLQHRVLSFFWRCYFSWLFKHKKVNGISLDDSSQGFAKTITAGMMGVCTGGIQSTWYGLVE